MRSRRGRGSGRPPVLLFLLFGAAVGAAAFFVIFFLIRTLGGGPFRPGGSDGTHSVIEAEIVDSQGTDAPGGQGTDSTESGTPGTPSGSSEAEPESSSVPAPADPASSKPDASGESGQGSAEVADVFLTTVAPTDLGRKSAAVIQNAESSSETVNASNVKKDGRAILIADGDVNTCWRTAAGSPGAGEWVRLTLGRQTAVSCIELYPGNWSGEKAFAEDGCPSEIEVTVGGETYPLTIEEGMRTQYIVFKEPVMTGEITIGIRAVREGGQGCCISEILVYR